MEAALLTWISFIQASSCLYINQGLIIVTDYLACVNQVPICTNILLSFTARSQKRLIWAAVFHQICMQETVNYPWPWRHLSIMTLRLRTQIHTHKTTKLRITSPLWREVTSPSWPITHKKFHRHDVTIHKNFYMSDSSRTLVQWIEYNQ